jgi:hypothetical protein
LIWALKLFNLTNLNQCGNRLHDPRRIASRRAWPGRAEDDIQGMGIRRGI